MDNKQSDKVESMRDILFSKGFITLFVITASKTFTNFLYGGNITEIGIALVKDADFVTKVTMIGGIFNFLVRYNMGNLYSIFGIKGLYLLNFLFEITESLILYCWGTNKLAYTAFAFIWRSSSGCEFNF